MQHPAVVGDGSPLDFCAALPVERHDNRVQTRPMDATEAFATAPWCRTTRLRLAKAGLDLDPGRRQVTYHGAVLGSFSIEDGVLVLADVDPGEPVLGKAGLRLVR